MGNLASCFGAGKEESKESEGLLAESNGHTAPLQARSIDVGVRGCFFWLSEHAERSMSMAERSSWMEATGKGECQDAAVSTEAFNSLAGTALAGVFDGHGIQGRRAALAGSESVLKYLQADPRWGPHSIPQEWERMFADACVQADADLAHSTQLNAEYSGTTACMAMVHNGTVYVANVGDSGACLGRLGPNGRTQAVELSKYARPNDPQEERRITKAGGRVLQMSNAAGRRVGPHRVFNKDRTAPGLAMSRSLGDGYAHSLGVSAAPTCTAHKLTPSDQFVVLATDGVWEVMTAQEVVHFVQRWRKRPWQGWNASDALTLEAQERWKQLQEEIMVDDAAAVVIMLAPEPKQAAKNLQAPAGACVASVSNAVANSPEAKAARDKLAALPYQNFFRHLQLDRLDSSGQGRGEYAKYNSPDDPDGPAAPKPGSSARGEPDPGARLLRALSRNTLLPQDVPSTSGGAGSSSKPNSASHETDVADVPTSSSAAASQEQHLHGSERADIAHSSPGRGSAFAPMSILAFADSFRSAGMQPEQGSAPSAPAQTSHPPPPRSPVPQNPFASPPASPAGQQAGQMWSAQPRHGQSSSPFSSRQLAPWGHPDALHGSLPSSLMSRASSSPSRLRMAKLTIPENEVSSLAMRASSGSAAVLPPIRKAYPSKDSLNVSPVASSPNLESAPESPGSLRSQSSDSLWDRCQRGGASEEGRVRGGMPRMHSAHALLDDMPLQPRSKLRSQSTRTFNKGGMGLRKTSADSLSTLHRPEECASFSNPFSGRNSSTQGAWGAPREHASKENKIGSRPMPVNPWSDVVPIQAKSGSLRGVQRGSSAAMEILRSSPQEYLMGLSHALSAPSAMLKASLQEGTPHTIQEEQPLLAADSCDSHGFAARLQSSCDHSAHSGSSCGGTSSSSAPAVQVADSANSMGVGGLTKEAASRGQCRKLVGDVHSMASQGLLVEP